MAALGATAGNVLANAGEGPPSLWRPRGVRRSGASASPKLLVARAAATLQLSRRRGASSGGRVRPLGNSTRSVVAKAGSGAGEIAPRPARPLSSDKESWEGNAHGLNAVPSADGLKSVAALVGLERATAAALKACDINFSAPVVLLVTLFALMLVDHPTVNNFYDFLKPGSDLFDKWLPMLFVPSVVVIPLSQLPGGIDFLKAAVLIVSSYVITLWGAAIVMVGVEKLERSRRRPSKGSAVSHGEKLARIGEAAKFWVGKAAKEIAMVLASAAAQTTEIDVQEIALEGARAMESIADTLITPEPPPGEIPLSTPFLFLAATGFLVPTFIMGITDPILMAPGWLLLTVAVYTSNSRLPEKLLRLLNPTVTTGALLSALAALYGKHSLGFWERGIFTYSEGAGHMIHLLVGPAIASLGLKVRKNQRMLTGMLPQLGVALAVVAPCALILTALMGRLIAAKPEVTLSVIPCTSTLGLALEMVPILGANKGLTIFGVAFIGALGLNTARSLLTSWRIKRPTARGLAVGAASHAGGTASLLVEEQEAAAVAGLTLAGKGALSVALLTLLPQFRQLLTWTAGY
eukprot:SM000142S00538  [mRNA]  locus=s142:228648:233635:+ [translate_table: standard]